MWYFVLIELRSAIILLSLDKFKQVDFGSEKLSLFFKEFKIIRRYLKLEIKQFYANILIPALNWHSNVVYRKYFLLTLSFLKFIRIKYLYILSNF